MLYSAKNCSPFVGSQTGPSQAEGKERAKTEVATQDGWGMRLRNKGTYPFSVPAARIFFFFLLSKLPAQRGSSLHDPE